MTAVVQVRKGAYQDSVTLMQVSREIGNRPDVVRALVAMASPLNLELLTGMGFTAPDDTTPADMLVAVETHPGLDTEDAIAGLDEILLRRHTPAGKPGATTLDPPPTIGAAARGSDANLALVSTPGAVAAVDAADALDSGMDVMLFSDNVPLAQEVALKEHAGRAGRIVMGPDCGTAMIGGVGLGFANVVRPGPVGIVAASGTGAQHLMTLLDNADVGVGDCFGVGGRDLSTSVGGRSTRTALDRLAADDDVQVIVVVSKPPDPDVFEEISRYAAGLGKPVVLGYLAPQAPTLTDIAEQVVHAVGATWNPPRRWGPEQPATSGSFLRGLFCGGTLCDEAMLVAHKGLAPLASNTPLDGHPALDDDLTSVGHTFIDFGDDRLTVGHPHPMIDGSLRLERLQAELSDPECGVVLADVVLGLCAHPDPAADLAAVIAAADKPVVISLVGSRDDPQGLETTAAALAEAGAAVHSSNAAATEEALRLLQGGTR